MRSNRYLRLLVTGSRSWPWSRAVEVRDAIVAEVGDRDPSSVIIVHGACDDPETGKLRGADAWADLTAVRMGYGVERFPVTREEWRRLGKRAGPLRNQRMVGTRPDRVLGFPLGRSSGTRGCVEAARKAGLPVRVVEG